MPISYLVSSSSTDLFDKISGNLWDFSENLGICGERRVVFKGGEAKEILNKKGEIDTIEDVKLNLSVLKKGLTTEATQGKIIVLQANIDKQKFSISREKLKDKMTNEKVRNIIEKNIKNFSAGQLLMAEEIFPGILKSMFIQDNQSVDFQGNREAESLIGLGDIFPLSQTYIVIYDERTGEWEAGVRGIKNTSMGKRPAYLNIGSSSSHKKNAKKPPSKPGDYIEILDNYKVVEISGKSGIDAFKKDIQTTDIKNIISKDEAIFDTKITNEKGEEVNSQADIQKNDKAKKEWVEDIGIAKSEKMYYYSENNTPEDIQSAQDFIDTTRTQKIPEDSIKTFLYTLQKETGRESSFFSNKRFIRTKVKPKPGKISSSAFGPVQITVSLAKNYAKKKGLFNQEEQEFLKKFIIQGKKMLKASPNDPIYGFGGTGEPYFRKPKNKVLYFQVAMKMFHDHIKRAGSPKKGLQWWRWGEFGAQKHEGEDLQYFQGLQKALQKKLPKTQKKPKKTSTTEKILYPEKIGSAPYISARKMPHLTLKRSVENALKISGFSDTIFIKNISQSQRYTPQELSEFTKEINKQYLAKGKNIPIIYIDNEGGTVQRVKQYPEISGESKNFTLLEEYSIQKKSLQLGKVSIQDVEESLERYPQHTSEILQAYAHIRIAQEKSLGLNSVSLVLDKSEKTGVIKRRGFKNPLLRKQYANILIEEAEAQKMQVLLKHFPGHEGFTDPHANLAGTRATKNSEMETFINILQENADKNNITVMLGHIKITAPGWESYDNEASKNIVVSSQSKTVADKLKAINPNIKLISDDIAGMKASGDIQKARKNAQNAEITILN